MPICVAGLTNKLNTTIDSILLFQYIIIIQISTSSSEDIIIIIIIIMWDVYVSDAGNVAVLYSEH